MKANFLPVAFRNSGISLQETLPFALLCEPLRLDHFVYLSTLYRRMAVGSLLLAGEPRSFFTYLSKSARAFLHFVRQAPDEEHATSKCEAFFDAVACRDADCAEALARGARATVNASLEYEDDFVHLRFLMDLWLGEVQPDALEVRLQRWAEVADGPDPKLAMCRALVERDQGAFSSALGEALEEIVDETARKRDADTLHPDDASTIAHVSTRALAWLEFAEKAGLQFASEVALAPACARLFHRLQPVDPESWRHLENFRSVPSNASS